MTIITIILVYLFIKEPKRIDYLTDTAIPDSPNVIRSLNAMKRQVNA
jgi:hypothetical protein